MHPWVKGIQICSNEGPLPFPRGDNYEIAKIHWQNFKKSSSPEPLGQFQPNLAQSILGWREFKFVQMKGPALLQGEIITKYRKYIDKIKKSSSPEPLGQFQPNLAQSNLGWRGFKFVQMTGPALFQGEIITKYRKYNDEIKKSSSQEPPSQFQPILAQASLDDRDSCFFKWRINWFSLTL